MDEINIKKTKTLLLNLLKKRSFKRKAVILSSGKKSNYYLDARICSLSGDGAFLIATIILNMIKNDKADAVGGLTLGADPIIGATIALSSKNDSPINGFIVRKEEKKHGLKKLIEGPALNKNSRVVIVDDVVTTGSSTISAIEAIKQIGCKIIRVIAVVDRLEGAKEYIKEKYGLKLEHIFSIKDFVSE